MNLGELKQTIDTLENDEFVFSAAFNTVNSYRGCYDQVAFAPALFIKLRQVKEMVRQAFTRTYYGYKGGEYIYKGDAICNLADYGSCGDNDCKNFEDRVRSMVEEYVEDGQPLKEMKMAKETKAQREARAERERQEALERNAAEYFPKLMVVLERACKNNMELNVVDGEFHVRDRDDGTVWVFPAKFSASFNMWELDGLETACEDKEEAEREFQRKQMVRRQALAKLTPEEREELGL